MIVVIDASVMLKWLLEDPATESETDEAMELIDAVIQGKLEIPQPAHWLIEVAAVAARLTPRTALQDVEALSATQFPTVETSDVPGRATRLSIDTGHHVFDTLYHSVALEHDATMLVTADYRYYRKVRQHGKIMALTDIDQILH